MLEYVYNTIPFYDYYIVNVGFSYIKLRFIDFYLNFFKLEYTSFYSEYSLALIVTFSTITYKNSKNSKVFTILENTEASFMKLLGLNKKAVYVWNYDDYKLNEYKLRKNAGIYGIYSVLSGKIYIGSAKKLSLRINQHLNTPLHSSKTLQKALSKYGKNNFKIIIFEVFDTDIQNLKQLLIDTENLYLNTIPKALLYNILFQAYTSVGYKHTNKSKALIKLKAKGKSISETVKRKISESLKGFKNHFYGKTHSVETRKKIKNFISRKLLQ